MQCYRHPDKAAVGICRACGKGVCAGECAGESGQGLGCSESCLQRLDYLEALNLRARATYGHASRHLWVAPVLTFLFGAVFVFYGLRERMAWNLGTTMGVLFIAAAIVLALRQRSWAKLLK